MKRWILSLFLTKSILNSEKRSIKYIYMTISVCLARKQGDSFKKRNDLKSKTELCPCLQKNI